MSSKGEAPHGQLKTHSRATEMLTQMFAQDDGRGLVVNINESTLVETDGRIRAM